MTKVKIIHNIKYILGENANENHKIIKSSNKEYWWFHLNKYSSGHCIVETNKINHNIIIIAGNYIKKNTKYKNRDEIDICYTQVKNIKILNTPGEVEFYNKTNLIKCYSTKIYHCSKYNGGCSSEYIIPNKYITDDKFYTGIYGVTERKNKDNEYCFNLQNPYILETDDECNNFINACKQLNYDLNNYILNANNILLNEIIDSFVKNINNFDKEYIYKKLKEFLGDYYNRKDMVMLPINYILMGKNYDGIYSQNIIIDTYNMGNVKFINYPSKKNNTIKFFKKRNDINEYVNKYCI